MSEILMVPFFVCVVGLLGSVFLIATRPIKGRIKPYLIALVVGVVSVFGISVLKPFVFPSPEDSGGKKFSGTSFEDELTANVDSHVDNVEKTTTQITEQPSIPESESSSDQEQVESSPASDAASVAEPSPAPASSSYDRNQNIIDTYRSDIVVAAAMTLDRFISDYDVPLATQLWTLAKFDNDGAVAAMADVTEKSTNTTETAIVVLTPVLENGKMTEATPHFVSVGDVIYGDDGSCGDVFSLVSGMFEGLS